MFLVGNVDSRDSHRTARKCAGTGGRCSVSGQRLPHRARSGFLNVTTAFHQVGFLAMVLTMNARRFQRTHHLSGMRSSCKASKDFGNVALKCGSEPVMDVVCTAVVGSSRTGRVLDAGSCHKDLIFRRMQRWRHTTVILCQK